MAALRLQGPGPPPQLRAVGMTMAEMRLHRPDPIKTAQSPAALPSQLGYPHLLFIPPLPAPIRLPGAHLVAPGPSRALNAMGVWKWPPDPGKEAGRGALNNKAEGGGRPQKKRGRNRTKPSLHWLVDLGRRDCYPGFQNHDSAEQSPGPFLRVPARQWENKK